MFHVPMLVLVLGYLLIVGLPRLHDKGRNNRFLESHNKEYKNEMHPEALPSHFSLLWKNAKYNVRNYVTKCAFYRNQY